MYQRLLELSIWLLANFDLKILLKENNQNADRLRFSNRISRFDLCTNISNRIRNICLFVYKNKKQSALLNFHLNLIKLTYIYFGRRMRKEEEIF